MTGLFSSLLVAAGGSLLPGLLLCALLLLLLTLGFPNLLLADETRRQQLIAQRHAHEMECSSEIYGCVV
jgi:hypothetical protein